LNRIKFNEFNTLRLHSPEIIGDQAIVRRVERTISGGGLARKDKNPWAWSIEIPIGDGLYGLYSARGERREWTDLNRLEIYLRELGFKQWKAVNPMST
jgi:hypothetical protein